jgi:hypothetical protein
MNRPSVESESNQCLSFLVEVHNLPSACVRRLPSVYPQVGSGETEERVANVFVCGKYESRGC